MEEQTTVVIDIQLNDEDVSYRLAQVNREMEELRKENAAMRKSVKDGTKTWEDVSDSITFPKGVRHGTAFKVDASVVENLKKIGFQL